MVGRWLCLGLVLTALPACCSAACREENLPEYKDRATPLRGALLLQYAIQNDCTRVAYDCLSKRSREEIPYWKFWLFFDGIKWPETDIYIVDLIRDFEPALDELLGERRGRVGGWAKDMWLEVILFREEGLWRVDGRETIEANGFVLPPRKKER